MAVIEWDDSLSVGEPTLDGHHRHLVGLLNRLHGAIHDADASVLVGQVLEDLIAYVGYHFAEEERLMAEAGCPDLAVHQAHHRQLTENVLEMKADYDANPRVVLAAELFEFLSEWLIHHIRVEDMAYRPFIAR